MKPTNVTGYPFSNGDRLTAVSVNQICNALDAIQDYNDTIKEFEDLLHEEITSTTEATTEVVRETVSSMDSVSASIEMDKGRASIISAINDMGGTASEDMSLGELADAIRETIVGNNVTAKGLSANVLTYISSYLFNSDTWGNLTKIKDTVTTHIDKIWAINLTGLQEVEMTELSYITVNDIFSGCTSLKSFVAPKLNTITRGLLGSLGSASPLFNIVFGVVTSWHANALGSSGYVNLRNVTIGTNSDINIYLNMWNPTNVISEGQSGIDELNSNLYNNLLTKLYDHSGDGQTRTLRIGWLANVTAENVSYANAKGWTLTT